MIAKEEKTTAKVQGMFELIEGLTVWKSERP